MKLSTRKVVIGVIGVSTFVFTAVLAHHFARGPHCSYVRRPDESTLKFLYNYGLIEVRTKMVLIIVFGLLAAISVGTFRKWARILSISINAIFIFSFSGIFFDMALGYIYYNDFYPGSMEGDRSGMIPWLSLYLAIIGLCVYFIIFLLHRDSWFIFEDRGKIKKKDEQIQK